MTRFCRSHREIGREYAVKWVFSGLSIILGGCSQIETVLDEIGEPTLSPHEAYVASLEQAGLQGTPLVTQWREAAVAAVRHPLSIDPPFREAVFYPGDDPTATAYIVSIKRGQSLQAILDMQPTDTTGIFLDVFQRSTDGSLTYVASAGRGSRHIEFEPRKGGTFVLRVQPELLRSVRVTLSVLRAATLAFPVQGRHMRDIGGRFGAPREGGRRSHDGIDVFAPRGTPVVASTDARVSRVRETKMGGRVVWLRDEKRRHSLYYAHLDRQFVESGQMVRVGDTIGLVGNTGNARRTPPHLHFGIYARGEGPLDPFAFVDPPAKRLPQVPVDSMWLGSWVRLGTDARVEIADNKVVKLESTDQDRPDRPADLALIPRHTVVRVISVNRHNLQVLLPDGGLVSLKRASLESIEAPIDHVVLKSGQSILSRPDPEAAETLELESGKSVPVWGRYGSYRLVSPIPGIDGWVSTPG